MEGQHVALYARVSTKDKGQTPETQLLPLRDYASHKNYVIFAEYVDVGVSGSKQSRPQLDKLMRDAKAQKFGAVIVWKFDRFARSTIHLETALSELRQLSIDFISVTEAIDTSTPMGKMVFTVLGAVAELERSLIRERVKAGVDRARRQGKQLGRPRKLVDENRLRQMAQERRSVRYVAKHLGCSRSVAHKLLKASEKPISGS